MTAGRFADFARRYFTVAILVIPLLLIAVTVQLLERVVLERIVIVFFINLIMVLALQMFMGNSGVVSFGQDRKSVV